jgi:hypothetical protein
MLDEPKPRKVKVPKGYKDEAGFIAEARERWQEAVDFDRENREAAVEDLRFFAGEQWDADALTARKGRPCLTINTLPQFVAQVAGDIRINRPAIKVRPAEEADKDLASVREGLIRAIERDNDAQGVYADTGQTQVACGIGHFRIGLKYASHDGFERDISMESIPNPFAVVWDPLSTERTGKDAQYCFVEDQIPRKAFEARWKDDLPSELMVPQTDVDGWATTDTVRVTEYWLMKETEVELALLEGGQVMEIDKVPPGQAVTKTRKSIKRTACMYLITGTAILSGPHELPVDRVPIIRVRGWEVNVQDKRVRFGLVRFARDSQRLKNYWRSVSAEVLAMAPRAQWLASNQAVPEDSEDDFRGNAKSGDPLLKWSGQGDAPKRIDPPPIPAAILQEAALNSQDMKDVTGLHDASLGARSNETSGKAIQARQREGDVASYIYHDNLQAAIKEGGRVVNQLIPIVFDTVRTIRVVGEDESTKVQRINDPNDPNSVDINKGKYDIVVETGPSYSTKRVEAAESMMQFVQSVPAAAQVAGDLIAKAQDWPLAEEIGERLKKTLPPQMTEGPDDELTPEQQQARQQAAQQMQEQQAMQQMAVKLEMDGKAATIDKTLADAEYTRAQAQKISQPAPGDPGKHPLELQMLEQQVRRAVAEADEAEAKAIIAQAGIPASVAKGDADAAKAVISVESDRMDLDRKPLEVAHSEADLNNKLNPPEPQKAKA